MVEARRGFPASVLVLDGDDRRRGQMQVQLEAGGRRTVAAAEPEAAVRELEAGAYDALFCDAALLEKLPALPPGQIVVVTAGPADLERALAAARFQAARSARPAAGAGEPDAGGRELLGQSRAMVALRATLDRAAQYKATALLLGESGTGKELCARHLHHQGPRSAGPFVAVNCGAIPATLLESELFGHLKGSFTGAVKDKPGLFEQAHGGTLFLDEIGELPAPLQVKLLRVLQEDEVRRVGATEAVPVDVRVVAATVRDLAAEAEAGRFRRDLFFRLNVLPIVLPPLRERAEDIDLLIDHFLERFARKHGKAKARLSEAARELVRGHRWPGNVRELENTIERAVVLGGDEIEPELIRDKLGGPADPVEEVLARTELSIKKATRAVERELIRRALEQTGGQRSGAARLLEISHRALLYKIKEYGL